MYTTLIGALDAFQLTFDTHTCIRTHSLTHIHARTWNKLGGGSLNLNNVGVANKTD